MNNQLLEKILLKLLDDENSSKDQLSKDETQFIESSYKV